MAARSVFTVLLCCLAPAFGQGYDPTNRGYVPGFELKDTPQVAWEFKSKLRQNFEKKMVPIGLGDLCLTDGVAYVGDDEGILRAFRSSDGELLWKHNHGERLYNAPICDGTRVYVSTEKGVEAVDCKSGTPVWKVEIPGSGQLAVWPARDPGEGKVQTLFVGSNDGLMNALIASTGKRRWRESMLENAPKDPAGFEGDRARIGESKARPRGIATNGKLVFQGIFDQSRVVALRAAGGSTVWSFPTKGWVGAAPTVDRDAVFVGSQDRKIYRVNKDTGEQQWAFSTGSRVSSAPAVHGNQVFASSCDGRMYCLDRETGDLKWKYRTDPDKTGRRFIYCNPIVTEDSIYFAVGCGLVYALDITNGELRWKIRPLPDSQLYSSLVTDGSRLFVTSRPDWDGNGAAALIAIGPKSDAE